MPEVIGYDGKPIDLEKGDAVIVSKYLRRPDETLGEFTEQYRKLTVDDKAQLAAGIRDGSLTYS